MSYEHETFFSTREFVESWCRTFGDDCKPLTVAVIGSGPSRTMHVIKTRLRYGLYKISSGYSDDFCLSPGWTEELALSTVKLILGQLRGIRTRSLLWKVRFDHEPLAVALNSLGLSHRRVSVHILKLERDYERVFALYNSTTRNQIRKAGRSGVIIRSTSNPEDILAYQSIYSKLARENKWEFIYPARLTMELIKFSDAARFNVAEYEGSVIGGALFLRDGNSIYYTHGVTDRTFGHLFATSALVDAGIRWACEIGAEFFNLGNSGQNRSLAQFKSFWGARLESDWVFEWHNPIWNGAVKLRTGVKRLLPKPMPASARPAKAIQVAHGTPWSQRAQLGELQAVCDADGSQRRNIMMHGAALVGAEKALSLARKQGIHQPTVLDFGCGTGRMVRFFGDRGCSVVGLDVTMEMLMEARKYGLPRGSWLSHFDGLSIPIKDHSVDFVWISGVLKYTLFPPGSKCRHGNDQLSGVLTDAPLGSSIKKLFKPTYSAIAKEMHRILKPGGFVANFEMFVDEGPDVFTPGFEQAGFVTERISVLRRYNGRLEALCEWRESYRLSPRFVLLMARMCAKLRYHLDKPGSTDLGFRDYLFIWRKPDQHDPVI